MYNELLILFMCLWKQMAVYLCKPKYNNKSFSNYVRFIFYFVFMCIYDNKTLLSLQQQCVQNYLFCNFFYSWAINMYKRKFASSVRIHHISALLVSYTWILFSLYHFWRKASFWNIYAIHIQIIHKTIYCMKRKWT